MPKKIPSHLVSEPEPPLINLNHNTVTYKTPDGYTVIMKNNPIFDGPGLQRRMEELKKMHADDVASQPGSTLDYCL